MLVSTAVPVQHRRGTRAVDAAVTGERGAVLILALVFLIVIGTMTAALLSYAFTGTKALAAYRLERTRRYAADSALLSTVNRLSLDSTLGNGTTFAGCGRIPITQYTTGGNITSVAESTAYVTVRCRKTPGIVVDRFDLDGGQAPRDITMEVVCSYNGAMVVNRKLTCGAGSSEQVIGRARVRFEPRYDAPDPTKRAVVPKVKSWEVRK